MRIRTFLVAAVVMTMVVALAIIAAACGAAETASTASSPDESAAAVSPPQAAAAPAKTPAPDPTAATAAEYGTAPELDKTGGWINSDPFTLAQMRDEGKVVLVDFWTYTCINCIRTLPYVKSWHDKYADSGLVILGVHTPEFEFEKLYENVVEASGEFGLEYPIVQDNDFGTWRAFNNKYWPAKYLIDRNGKIRYRHFGEGKYEETELKIREILGEAGYELGDISAGVQPVKG